MTESDFDARVVVSSAQTVADIPALMHAIAHLEGTQHDLEACRNELANLTNRAHALTGDPHGMAHVGAENLQGACSTLANSADSLTQFIHNLAYTALIYSAAEGDAAAFARIRAQLYPSLLTYLEVGTSINPFSSAHLATFMRLPPQRSGPWRQAWRNGGRHNIWPMPFQASAAYAAIYGAIFGSGMGSDPVDSLAMQFHVEEVSRGLMRSTHWYSSDKAFSLQELGTQADSATPEAAAVAGGALFGWGRLLNGNRRSIILGRPAHAPHTPWEAGTARPRSLRLPLRPHSSVWSRTLIPGAPGFSQFLNLGHDAGRLPAGTVDVLRNAHPSGGGAGITHLTGGAIPHGQPLPPMHAPREVTTPHAPSSLIERIGNLAESKEYGEFEILKHETSGAHGVERSWSVIIRGTQEWTAGTTNIQDMHTNFNAIAGLESDQTQAIKAAMADMGIKPTEAVEFVGHSQGGIVAAQLASDTEIRKHYSVAAVLTAGAPTAGYNPDTSVGMLNLENTRDQVLALDGRENANRGNNLTVHFDGMPLRLTTSDGQDVFAHDMSVYREAMAHFEEAPTTGTAEVSAWIDTREKKLGLKDTTRTTSYVYTTQRSSQ